MWHSRNSKRKLQTWQENLNCLAASERMILFMGTIRLGIAGRGGMALQRAQVFAGLPGVDVAGVFARSLEKAAPISSSADFFGDYEKMLDAVDAVVVCVPNDAHATLARAALEAGKHVLVEYPLAPGLAEAQSLAAAARESGCVLMTGNTMFHESLFAHICKKLEGLGAIVSAASRVAWFDPGIADAWYLDPRRSGPCFVAFHYHHIAIYRRLLGEVAWVQAREESRVRPDGTLSLAGGTLLMAHAGGATSVIQWYLGCGSSGLARSLVLTGLQATLTILSDNGPEDTSRTVWNGEGHTEVFPNTWGVLESSNDFLHAIRGELDHLALLDDDLLTLSVATAAARSADSCGIVQM